MIVVISGDGILKHVEFAQLQDHEPNVCGLGEKHLHLLHLNSHQLLVDDSGVQAVRLVHQLRSFHSSVHEVDVLPLPLVLTSFAMHGVIH